MSPSKPRRIPMPEVGVLTKGPAGDGRTRTGAPSLYLLSYAAADASSLTPALGPHIGKQAIDSIECLDARPGHHR